MRLILIILLLQCIIIRKTNPIQEYSQPETLESSVHVPIYVILIHDKYENGSKESRFSVGDEARIEITLINQFQYSNQLLKVEKDIEKAELVVEIEIETRNKNNRVLPYITALTLTLIPFYEDIEIIENFRIIKKNGEVLFQTKRIQKLDYWFGLAFIINGFIQYAKPEHENDLKFKEQLIEKMNRDIVRELSLKKLK